MEDKFNLDNSIKQELTIKADEAKPSAEMLPRIINRIEAYEGGKVNMLRDRMPNINIKKLAIVSLCAVLLISGVMFTFSEDVRAAAMDVIRTIFVLDKTEDGYALLEKTDQDELFTPTTAQGSELSNEQLTEKMGFKICFPEELYGGYKLKNKSESVGVSKPISWETSEQLFPEMSKAINDETAYSNLSEYKPFRGAAGIYANEAGTLIFIGMKPDVEQLESHGIKITLEKNLTLETNAGKISALWREVLLPDYKMVKGNEMFGEDVHTKPEGFVKLYELKWDSNGVKYYLSPDKDKELTSDEAVKIAESFMAQQ